MDGVVAAARRLRGLIQATPVLRAPALDRRIGCELLLKAEHLQTTGAFKVRGALAAVTARASRDRRRLVTASAGNFGQGVAVAASHRDLDALVLVPEGTPRLKIDRIRRFGGEVRIAGRSFDECDALARALAAETGADFLPPFDHPRVIEGQGTLALELLGQIPGLDAVVVPCGGGGLLAGVATVLAARRPDVRLIAAEPTVLPSLDRALAHGAPIELRAAPTVADGVAVRRIGALPFQLLRDRVDAVVRVDEEAIVRAIRLLAVETKQMVEGAGATALAALLARPDVVAGCRRVGVLVTGGNIDPDVFAHALAGRGGPGAAPDWDEPTRTDGRRHKS